MLTNETIEDEERSSKQERDGETMLNATTCVRRSQYEKTRYKIAVRLFISLLQCPAEGYRCRTMSNQAGCQGRR